MRDWGLEMKTTEMGGFKVKFSCTKKDRDLFYAKRCKTITKKIGKNYIPENFTPMVDGTS